MTKICKHCQSEFSQKRSRHGGQIFCSIYCKNRSGANRFSIKKNWEPAIIAGLDSPCFEYVGLKIVNGYPKRRSKSLHRIIYEEMFGELLDGQVVRHRCDNKICINPEHLKSGSQKENIIDSFERNRRTLKLTGVQIKEIRNSVSPSDVTASKYNVSARYVRKIRKSNVAMMAEIYA